MQAWTSVRFRALAWRPWAGIMAATLLLPAQSFALPDLIGVTWLGDVYQVNAGTGHGTLLGSSGFTRLNSLTRDAAGNIWSTTSTSTPQLIRIDPTTGQGTAVATLNPAKSVCSLAARADGSLYGIELQTTPQIFTINRQTGRCTYASGAFGPFTSGMEFGPDGFLYGYDRDPGLMRLDLSKGGYAVDVNPAVNGVSNSFLTIAFAPNGELYGANNALHRIDRYTGESTFVASIDVLVGLRGMVFLPEPATWSLMAMAGVMVVRRRR